MSPTHSEPFQDKSKSLHCWGRIPACITKIQLYLPGERVNQLSVLVKLAATLEHWIMLWIQENLSSLFQKWGCVFTAYLLKIWSSPVLPSQTQGSHLGCEIVVFPAISSKPPLPAPSHYHKAHNNIIRIEQVLCRALYTGAKFWTHTTLDNKQIAGC